MSGPVNVMVTGVDAPIGERVVRALLADSRVDQVLGVCQTRPEDLPFREDSRLSLLQVDLSRSRRVRNLLFGPARDRGVQAVVHTAMHRSAHAEGRSARALNVEALRSILELSERHPTIDRLVVRSDAAVYQVQKDLPILIGEHHPINMQPNAPQWVRDRVEADLTACTRMGIHRVRIMVLRMAEVLGPGTGSQLHDYLESPLCLRPAGFDPMVNVLTIEDAAVAIQKAVHSDALGAINIPGADTLPLSTCIRSWGRMGLPVPGAWMTPLYRWRRRFTGHDFRYGMNRRRFHYSGVLDGTRAREVLGFVPCHPVDWPVDAT